MKNGHQSCAQPPPWRTRYIPPPPSDRVAQLYPQAPHFLSAARYDSQGHGGGNLTHLHMGYYNDTEY
jgi:hypothetical protein